MTLPIAIVTVTFNTKLQLIETVEALRTFRDVIDQFIVIDGASDDGTREFIASERTITTWVSEPDAGIYDAMNKGWALVKAANRILYLGAGDKLLSLPAATELNSKAIIYGDVMLEDAGRFEGRADWRLRFGNTLHHQALLVPKELHPAPPFNCRYPTYADYDFNLRLLRQGALFKKSHDFTSYAAAGGASHALNELEMCRVVAENFGRFAKLASRAYMKVRKFRPSSLVSVRS